MKQEVLGVMFSRTEDSDDGSEWETPWSLFRAVDREFNFTLDVSATENNAKCKKFYTRSEDGLEQSWDGETVWCNPPYGDEIKFWLRKGVAASRSGSTVVYLLPARTDTDWFHRYVYRSAEVRFLKGRVKYIHADGRDDAAPFPSMLVIYRSVW